MCCVRVRDIDNDVTTPTTTRCVMRCVDLRMHDKMQEIYMCAKYMIVNVCECILCDTYFGDANNAM